MGGAFTFIGAAAFSGTAGELRYGRVGANLLLMADTDGTATADIMIRLDGVQDLTARDLLL